MQSAIHKVNSSSVNIYDLLDYLRANKQFEQWNDQQLLALLHSSIQSNTIIYHTDDHGSINGICVARKQKTNELYIYSIVCATPLVLGKFVSHYLQHMSHLRIVGRHHGRVRSLTVLQILRIVRRLKL